MAKSTMANSSEQQQQEHLPIFHRMYHTLSSARYDTPYLSLLLIFELMLTIAIVMVIPYTNIDWMAYMQQVSIYLQGERDYYQIKGNTGPLVYPAAFLYLYSFLQKLVGWTDDDSSGDAEQGCVECIYKAQMVFVVLYVVNQGVVLHLYSIVGRRMATFAQQAYRVVSRKKKDDDGDGVCMESAHIVWCWRVGMLLCCLSKRIHSIFVLQLFNNGPAMLFFYISAALFASSKYHIGCIFYSLAVGIKMNILLFAPGLLLVLLQAHDNIYQVIFCLAICASVQLALGFPFLTFNWVHYLRKAFELDRVFMFKWTVNWKFLPEQLFLSKLLSVTLLVLHLYFLGIFAYKSLLTAKAQTNRRIFITTGSNNKPRQLLTPEYILYTIFTSNMVGIIFARTLHYQFYSWYFHTVPMLLLLSHCSLPSKPTITKSSSSLIRTIMLFIVFLCILMGIEYAFNVYPATPFSSAVLQLAHFVILILLLFKSSVPQILQTVG